MSDDSDYAKVGEGRLGRLDVNYQVTPMGNLVYVGDDHGVGSAFVVHDVEPDRTPPQVVAVSPRDGATAQAVTTRVGVAFSDSVLLESATTESLRLVEEDGDVVAGMYSVHLGIANFAPASCSSSPSFTAVSVAEAELDPSASVSLAGSTPTGDRRRRRRRHRRGRMRDRPDKTVVMLGAANGHHQHDGVVAGRGVGVSRRRV